jgi:hypothetical protein
LRAEFDYSNPPFTGDETWLEGRTMTLFGHQFYEIRKGVRDLALLTASEPEAREAARWLRAKGMECFVQRFGTNRANVFFGRPDCVEVARRILRGKLNELTDEEDFILGALLGYDCRQQCRRYLRRKDREGRHGEEAEEAAESVTSEPNEVYA